MASIGRQSKMSSPFASGMCPRNIQAMPVRVNRKMQPEEIDPADLAALEQLVRYGLADVVTIDGEPHYTLGPRLTGTAPASSA
jgi:hypothetical protein